MFRSRKNVFKPSVYESGRRRSRGLPRWVVILLTGILIGAAGFWFIRTNYGPEQLSVSESQALNRQVGNLTQDKRDLSTKVEELNQRLEAYENKDDKVSNTLENSKSKVEDLEEEITILKQALPDDPSGKPVGIRGANLNGEIGKLNFALLLTKKDQEAPEINAVMEIVVKGRYKNGRIGYSTLEPIEIQAGDFTQVKGEQELDQETLTPNTATITIRDAESKKVLGQRAFDVNSK